MLILWTLESDDSANQKRGEFRALQTIQKKVRRVRSRIKRRLKKVRQFCADNAIAPGCSVIKRPPPELIVSLTSFPARIHRVHITINSILRQTVRPDRVILWLAEEQFPKREEELPQELLLMKKFGLEIRWCHDLKSYKKLIPALREFPDDVIVTADDDVYYAPRWLEYLYTSFQAQPNYIHCHRNTLFYRENDEWKWIGGGKKQYPRPSYLHKLVGIGGVLYPPHSLHPDVLREDIFTDLAPTNDDIWFWFMAIRNHFRILVVEHCMPNPRGVEGLPEEVALCRINDQGPRLFVDAFQRLLEFYPEVQAALIEEWAHFATQSESAGSPE